MRSGALVLALAALVASGCGRRDHYGYVPRVDARRLRNLHAVASREMACPAAALEARALSDRVWQVTGCGQAREFAILARGSGRRRGARWRVLDSIGTRAVSEMACPPQGLAITAPQPLEREVVGCGRRATYQVLCGDLDCAWVMSAHSGAWADMAGTASDGAVVADASSTGAPATVVVVVDPASSTVAPAVDAALRAAIDARRASVLACAGDAGPLAVVARWGSDGEVWIGLGAPHAGSPAEPCVRAALGALRVPIAGPGELIHVVR